MSLRGMGEELGHTSVGSSRPPPGPWCLTHPILLHFSWADIPISPCSYRQLIALTCWWILQQTRNFYLWPRRVGEYLWSTKRCRRLWLKTQKKQADSLGLLWYFDFVLAINPQHFFEYKIHLMLPFEVKDCGCSRLDSLCELRQMLLTWNVFRCRPHILLRLCSI